MPLIRAILDYAARYKFHICMYVCLNVNISKTVGDTSKVTINDYLGERILLAISQYGSCMGPMHRAYALSIRIKIDDLG